MKNIYLTSKQGIILTFLFLSGGSFAFGNQFSSLRDSWLSFIIATILAFPLMWVYGRLLTIDPDKNIFQLFLLVFGTFLGKVISIAYILFTLMLTTMMLHNFGKFATLDSMQSTPAFVMILVLAILCIYGLRKDITTMGRWSEMVLPIILLFTIIILLLSLLKGDFTHLLPIMAQGITPLLADSAYIFTFFYGQAIILLGVLSFLNKKASSFHVLSLGIIFTGIFSFISFTKNLIVLGPELMSMLPYPGFYAANILHFENVFQSLEMLVAANYFFSDFIKISICLLFVCLGLSVIIEKNSYQKYVIPVTILAYLFTFFFSTGFVSIKSVMPIYAILCVIFEIFVPLLALLLHYMMNHFKPSSSSS